MEQNSSQYQLVQSVPNPPPNIGELLSKYGKLIWQKKIFIFLMIISMSVVWYFAYKVFLEGEETYTTTAIVKFDDPRQNRGVSAVTNFAVEGSISKAAILTTNSFLKDVIDSLKLNLILIEPKRGRLDLIKKVNINEDAKYGRYDLNISGNNIEIFYTNKVLGFDDKLIKDVKFNQNSLCEISINGIEIHLNSAAFGDLSTISMVLTSKRKMLESLKENIVGILDRSGIILSISYTDIDPAMSTMVTNTVADMYINKLTEIKRFKTIAVLETFEEQLNVARQELDKSESGLRAFRESKPYLMLTNAGSEIVLSLAANQTKLENLNADLDRLNILLPQSSNSDFAKKSLAYLEILSILEARLVAGSQVYTSEYQDLITRHNTLLSENYSPGHPQVKHIEDRLTSIQSEVDERAQQYYNELIVKKNKIKNTINKSRGQIRRLPGNELQLAELQRDRGVKENIYSSILIRYNEAKIADAAIIPDAFVIEEAEIPLTETSLVAKLQILIKGPIIGLVLSIGLIILMDLFDGTIKESKQIEFKMDLPVLSSIPVILSEDDIPPELEDQPQLDPKLITSDYGPHLAGEKFRLLRTKLTLNNKLKKKILIITSHSPGDGKSLIASNLAITYAQQKMLTVLIDCDLRRGVLHHSFKCNKTPGISDLLISSANITKVAIDKITRKTHVPNLLLISSGQQIPNPSELLGSKRMQTLLKALAKYYQNIIIDTPPFAVISDALVLDNFVHNMMLVVRYGKTNLNNLNQKIEEYKSIKSDFRGVVLNATEEVFDKDYYSYSYYHY